MFRRALLVSCAAVVAAPLFAQIAPARAAALERIATTAQTAAMIPGLSVAIARGEGPIWTGAWGYADLENQLPARPENVYRIASISKTFTAVAAMALVEEGKLDLDVPIQTYLPSFPKKPWPIAMRQLLGHLGGIRHYRPDSSDMNSTRHFWSVNEALEMFAYDPLEHEPGTKYMYTSYGFNLAGAVVERVAQTSFVEYVKSRILAVSGADTMQADDVYKIIPHRVRGYRKSGNIIENCGLADTSNKIPGGGWVASASDLVKYAQTLMRGSLLKPETMQLMWTSQTTKSGSKTNYGMGWGVRPNSDRQVVTHSGGQQGASSFLLLVPSRKIAVAVLANLEGAPVERIANDLLAALEEGES